MTLEHDLSPVSSSSKPASVRPLDLQSPEELRDVRGQLASVILSEVSTHFIAMLSHELRTPLTPAIAAIALLRRLPELSSESRELVELVARNVATEAQLIDDLLDVTALQRGHFHVDHHPVGLQRLLTEAIRGLGEAAAIKGIAFLHEAVSNEYYSLGDASRLREVFSRILNNAIKFTPSGGTITVRTWQKDARLLIEIRDNGIGFEPAKAARLFDLFHQAGQGNTRTAGLGLGLGLAICKGVVKLHGGEISARSNGLGTGACFTVALPTLSDSERVDIPVVAQERIEVTEITSVSRQHLLLVEDHADTAEILTMLLEEQGFTVVVADSIAGALKVKMEDIDLVISDIGLPDGTGTDLLRQLKNRRWVPAIALSGYGMDSDVEDSLRAGFDYHLTKPVDFESLLKSIRELLKASAVASKAGGQAGR